MWAMVVLAGGYTICISKSSYVSAQVLMWAHLSLGHLLIYKQIEFKSEILLSTSNESRKRLFLNFSQMWGGGSVKASFKQRLANKLILLLSSSARARDVRGSEP